MANEIRRRDIGIGGTITDSPLTSVATTFNSAQLAAIVNGVVAGEYMAVTLDPDQIAGAPEVVYITALTSGATTATIIRGREGTTARSHASGTTWRHAITPADVERNPDAPDIDTAGIGADYEFEAHTTSLPSGWSWVNQGSAVYNEGKGAGLISDPTAVAENWRMLVQAIPSAVSWTASVKLGHAIANSPPGRLGLILRDSVSGKFVAFSHDATINGYMVRKWTSPTAYGGSDFATNLGTAAAQNNTPSPHIWRIIKNSATSWDFYVGYDGIAFSPIAKAIDVTPWMTPNQIGFGFSPSAIAPNQLSCHWFRVR